MLLPQRRDRSFLTEGWGTFGLWFALVTITAGGRPMFRGTGHRASKYARQNDEPGSYTSFQEFAAA